jgi:hypothetical protein
MKAGADIVMSRILREQAALRAKARKMSREFAAVYNALSKSAKPQTMVVLQLLTDLTYRQPHVRPGEPVEVVVSMVGRPGDEIEPLSVELKCLNHLQYVHDCNYNLLCLARES